MLVLKELRADGLSRDARSREHAAAAEVAAERHHGHGAHLDARMSGTAYGTVVLHVAPEAAAGGRSRWSRTAIRSSSMWPRAACTWTCRRPSWRGAGRGGNRPRRLPGAAITDSTATMSCRPTGARTWISWSAAAAWRSRGTHTNSRGQTRVPGPVLSRLTMCLLRWKVYRNPASPDREAALGGLVAPANGTNC